MSFRSLRYLRPAAPVLAALAMGACASDIEDEDHAWAIPWTGGGALWGLAVGDVDGDGNSDVLFSTPGDDHGSDAGDLGSVFLYTGSEEGPVESWRMESAEADARFGDLIGRAGDTNGDGHDDVFVSLVHYALLEGEEVSTRLFLGATDGLSTEPSRVSIDPVVPLVFPIARSLGNLNGDSFGDVVISRARLDETYGAYFPTWADVYAGSAEGLSAAPIATLEVSAGLGIRSVEPVGDVNGDGFDDVALLEGNEWEETYAARVHLGSADGPVADPDWSVEIEPGFGYALSLAGVGDVNGDGYDDLVTGEHSRGAFLYLASASGLSASPDEAFDPQRCGAMDVDAADFNGDGLQDVLVATNCSDGYGSDVFIYLGSAEGLQSRPDRAAHQPGNEADPNVQSIGDVDGDGYDEIMVFVCTAPGGVFACDETATRSRTFQV